MSEPAHFIKTFVVDLDAALTKLKPNARLTNLQRLWLGFCLTGMLLTNSVCWAKFERASLGKYKIGALSWMFREAKVAWDYLLLASVTVVLEWPGITEGVLVLDESDRRDQSEPNAFIRCISKNTRHRVVTSTVRPWFYYCWSHSRSLSQWVLFFTCRIPR